jgi:hypothetical protein
MKNLSLSGLEAEIRKLEGRIVRKEIMSGADYALESLGVIKALHAALSVCFDRIQQLESGRQA